METLGQFLKRERELRKISLEAVSRATKISAGILKKLEEDQFATLPGGAYLKGYFKSYTHFLGLNLEEVLSRCEALPAEFQKEENPLKKSDVLVLKNGIPL